MIDVTRQLTSLTGEGLEQAIEQCPQCGNITAGEPITLRRILVNALMATPPGKQQTGSEKIRQYVLAQDISTTDELELEAEDIVLLKQLVGELYGPLVVGQVWGMLDPAMGSE